MNDPSQMMNRAFGIWPPPLPPAAADDPMGFQTPRAFFSAGVVANPGRVHWKVKKAAEKRKKAAAAAAVAGSGAAGSGAVAAGAGASGYRPPRLTELQFQNHVKTRRFYPKKKSARFAPYAPRNTTSFIIRAKKSGGIASLVSPCPVTPAILPTPKFSPSREGLVDMAKEEWGVDGYGSMKGLIRLRSPTGMEVAAGGGWGGEEDEEVVVEEEEGSSDSDVEEHLEVERRLDHDLSRFEMVYPGNADDHGAAAYVMENRLDDQDTHIAHLEEENLTLKERLFLVETEMGDLRRRLQLLEREFRVRSENDNKHRNDDNCNLNANEEASENDNNSTLNAIEESSESDTMNANVEGPENETMNTNKEGPEIDTMNDNKEASEENDTNNYTANNISLNVDEKALEKDGGGDARADGSIGDCEESNKIAGNYEEMNKSVGNCKESSDTQMRE